MIALGEGYYELENEYIPTVDEKNQLENLFRQLEGDWLGDLIFKDCKGSVGEPREEYQDATLEVDIELDSAGNLNIHAEKTFAEDNVLRLENLELLNGFWIYDLNMVADNHFVFIEKSRRNNVNAGARLVETRYEIIADQSSLSMQRVTYINGYYASQEEWQLFR
ncbi:hypothetical protein GCM10027217_47060 [Pseudomaricurvus hydrocarbonicus]